MSMRRPEVFISATSRDLATTRQIVRDALLAIGCHPIVQEHFGPNAQTVRQMLRQRIAQSDAVIHLAGECYGAEPPWEPAKATGPRRSFTQIEYDLARELGKPLYLFVCPEGFPYDPYEREPDDLRALQEEHRQALLAGEQLYEEPPDPAHLALRVRELSTRLELLTQELRETRSLLGRGVAVGLALLTLLAGGVWWVKERSEGQAEVQAAQIADLRREVASLAAKTLAAAPALAPAREVAALARGGGLNGKGDPVIAAQQLVAENRRLSIDELRARIAQAGADTAQRLRLIGQLRSEIDSRRMEFAGQTAALAEVEDSARALQLASLHDLADAQLASIHYGEALGLSSEAEKLTDRTRDPVQWADTQRKIAYLLFLQGSYVKAAERYGPALAEYQRAKGPNDLATLAIRAERATALNALGYYEEAEAEHRAVLALRQQELGAEHPDTLTSQNNLAIVLFPRGKIAEAEAELLAVLAVRARVLGPEDRDTLKSRNNLATVLYAEGKDVEAEAAHREVLAVRARVLGAEHPETLNSRNNLAVALVAQGKDAQAEGELRAAIEISDRVLGAEHPDTLGLRANLALALHGQSRNEEAETEVRTVLTALERVLGAEHPNTLISRNNLAHALDSNGKHAEAEGECRKTLAIRERLLGREHPATLESRHSLANTLAHQGKYGEAEADHRVVLGARERLLGGEHPDTLSSCYSLASALKEQDKVDEAREYARRAAEGARKVLGADHRDTKDYEELWRALQEQR